MILAIDQGTTGTTCLVFDEEGAPRRPRLPRVRPALPPPRLGGARRRTRSGRSPGRWRARPATMPGGPRAEGHRHHEPARDGGGLGPAHRRAAPPRDRVAGPPHRRALRRAARGRPRAARSASARGWCSTPTSPGRRSSGCCARAAVRAGRPVFGTIDSWLVFKLTGRARDRLLERVAHAAVRHPHAAAGTRSCASCWACDPAALPEPAPSASVLGTTTELGGLGAGGRDRRRPAGGALRPGLPHARARQEHLRHRQLRAPERGRARRPRRRTGCSPPWPGEWRAGWTTRSRRRSS